MVRASVKSAHLHGAGFLASLTWWAVIIFGLLAAFSQLGIAVAVVNALITGLIAMLALAFGLAFGLRQGLRGIPYRQIAGAYRALISSFGGKISGPAKGWIFLGGLVSLGSYEIRSHSNRRQAI